MFVNNINDDDLCRLIFKASINLFPNYRDMFNNDLEEFKQLCAYLMLKQLKKYDSKKSSVSTYIYTHMPLILGVWIRQSDAKQILMENYKLDISNSIKDTDLEEEEIESSIYADDYDLKEECISSEEHKHFMETLSKYPIVEKKILNDYNFAKLGKELGVSTRIAKYMFYRDLQKLIKNEENLLKSLYFF